MQFGVRDEAALIAGEQALCDETVDEGGALPHICVSWPRLYESPWVTEGIRGLLGMAGSLDCWAGQPTEGTGVVWPEPHLRGGHAAAYRARYGLMEKSTTERLSLSKFATTRASASWEARARRASRSTPAE